MRKTILSMLLAGALLAPATGQAAPPGTPTPPDVQTLETSVPDYDPMGGIATGIVGLYERTVSGTGGRTAKIYAPEGAPLGAYMVVMNVPDGEDTVSWLMSSGWIDRADEQKFLLYVLEPDSSGEWGTPARERSYIETAYNNISLQGPDGRGIWYLPPESYYVVGYDDAGSVLQEVVMKNPILVAAAAFVDASDIDASTLESMNDVVYPTPDWEGNPVASSSVPVPVWLINDASSSSSDRVVSYWKEANQTEFKGTGFQGGKIFRQADDTLRGYVAESSKTAVAVMNEKNVRRGDSSEAKLTEKIYDRFLSGFTRYGGNVGGNTVGERPEYDELGVEYKTMELGGRLREYLVYVPDKAKAAARRGDDVPLVVSLHGGNMTMYSMFDFSRWWEVAEKEGFILLVPTGLNNNTRTSWASDANSVDMTFMQLLLDEMKAEYNVDEDRVYLGGQSNGSSMTQAVGRNLSLSPKFTALGATSSAGGLSTNYDGELLPMLLMVGEFDNSPWQLETSSYGAAINYWIHRNDALGTISSPASERSTYRRTVWSWANAQGTDVVRYGVTWGRGHSIIPEEMQVLWDWYELWEKNELGDNTYVGP